jgi:acyl-[acyl-carrier-protein] desaturase
VERAALLAELTPVVEQQIHRHLEICKPWYPHEVVPWSLGRDYCPDYVWDGAEAPLPDGVRSAIYVNLLTEDNLPYYLSTIDATFGAAGPWREWSHRWTAEEARHSQAMRDLVNVTRIIDPVWLEDGRMAQMSTGVVPNPGDPLDAIAYVSMQELATRIAHRNTAKAIQDHLPDHPVGQAGYEVLARVAADENFHFLFYRDLLTAALAVDPSETVQAIERQVRAFEMPGVGIPGFREHAEAIAKAEIYNLRQHHDQILEPLVKNWWKIEALEGLTSAADQARASLLKHVDRIGALATRMADRAKAAADRAARGLPTPA